MTKTDTIRIKINPEIKSEAEEVLSKLGITVTQAINIFLNQIALRGGMPFDVRLPRLKAEVLARIESIENGTAEMLGPFETFEEYKRSLEEPDDED